MLHAQDQARILELTTSYWRDEVRSDAFRQLATGKEIGHRIADLVDEQTTFLIQAEFETRQEQGARGVRARSMGDIWVLSNGIFNPINIKAGEAGKRGQPNLVSLVKVLGALLKRQIDSYYVLIVKATLGADPTVAVYLADILSYLPYTTYDSGPGQMMLREQDFYNAMDRGELPSALTIADKIAALLATLEDADRRLFANRQKRYARIKASLAQYETVEGHLVDQRGLLLG